MKLFSGRSADLEVKNRILTDAARKRAERVEELESQLEAVKSERAALSARLQQLQVQHQHLTENLAVHWTRIQQLEKLVADSQAVEPAEPNRQLDAAATAYSLRIEQLEEAAGADLARIHALESDLTASAKQIADLQEQNHRLVQAAGADLARMHELEHQLTASAQQIGDLQERDRHAASANSLRIQQLESQLAAAAKQVGDLQEHNRQLTDAATKYSARGQELESELLAVRTEIAVKDFPRLEAERAFYQKLVLELEEHNRQLTEAARMYSLWGQVVEKKLRAAGIDYDRKDSPFPVLPP